MYRYIQELILNLSLVLDITKLIFNPFIAQLIRIIYFSISLNILLLYIF